MGKRYDHMMDVQRSQCWPSTVVIVSCEARQVESHNGKVVRREELTRWCAAVLDKPNGEYRNCGIVHGTEAASFWTLLHKVAKQGRSCYVISCECMRVWSLLGLWEELENGILSIGDSAIENLSYGPVSEVQTARTDTNVGCVKRKVQQLRGRVCGGGYIITGDPPNILYATICATGARFTWIDSRNFGVCPLPEVAGKIACTIWLEAWFSRFHALAYKYKLGGLKTTASSQAMHAFRTNYHHSAVYCHCEPEAIRLETAALYGGRCECFRIGEAKAPLWHYDFRSVYAWIMYNYEVPTRLKTIHMPEQYPTVVSGSVLADCIADVTVSTNAPLYPYRNDNLVIYPIGTFRTVLCGDELCNAALNGHISQIHSLAEYHHEPILKEAARSFYAMRAECDISGDRANSALAKFLYCGIVGRLAQRSRRWINDENAWTDLLYGEWTGRDDRGNPHRYRSIAGVCQREEIGGYSPESVPAITAVVMANARYILLQAIKCAGWENVYYVDTDSLLVNGIGRRLLDTKGWISQGSLGHLQYKAGPCHVEILGIKHYIVDGKRTCSGLPLGEYRDCGDGTHYWYTVSADWQIAHGRRPDNVKRMGTYKRKVEYPLGTVTSDGIVRPFLINGD